MGRSRLMVPMMDRPRPSGPLCSSTAKASTRSYSVLAATGSTSSFLLSYSSTEKVLNWRIWAVEKARRDGGLLGGLGGTGESLGGSSVK